MRIEARLAKAEAQTIQMATMPLDDPARFTYFVAVIGGGWKGALQYETFLCVDPDLHIGGYACTRAFGMCYAASDLDRLTKEGRAVIVYFDPAKCNQEKIMPFYQFNIAQWLDVAAGGNCFGFVPATAPGTPERQAEVTTWRDLLMPSEAAENMFLWGETCRAGDFAAKIAA